MLVRKQSILFRKWQIEAVSVVKTQRRDLSVQINEERFSPKIGDAIESKPNVLNLMIGGKMLPSKSKEILPVINPATGQILRYVPESTEDELEAAVHSAREAFSMWRDTSVSKRSRVMFEYQRLIREREDELVQAIVEENGKTIADAKGDVFRGLEVVEQCCALGNHMMGETLANAAIGIDTYSYKEPLGICAGIAPFNFPAMIPLWMFPVGITCGNTYILKPSEKVPSATMILAEMALQAGLPPGVLNVVHGTKPVVDFLCRAPEIKAISFVGGNKAGEYIFAEATRHGKRCQANLGAKNHGVILPDADKEKTLDALVAASMGAAGQRCMALSVAVFVGNSSEWIPELAQRCARLKVGDGADPNSDVGPMISPESKSRAVNLIGQALNKGAKIELDGRNYSGNFLGPTVLSQVSTDSPAYLHELFAPVLSCTCVETLDEAIALVNANPTGNGTAIFTNSGASARLFQREIDVGQVGINVPIPVPLPFFSFTGSRASIRGDLHFYGKQGVTFYTQTKTITSNWRTLHHDESPSKSPSTAMPIMK